MKILGEDLPKLFAECDEVNEHQDHTMFMWYSIKWYESYDEVKEVMVFVEGLIEKQEAEGSTEILVGFMRIGEDYEDIEVMGEPYDFGLSIHREICYS